MRGSRWFLIRGLGACVAAFVIAAPAASADQFAYVSGFDDGTIAAGRVDPGGGITPLGGSPFGTDSSSLEGIVASASGKRLFTVGESEDNLYGFSIIPGSGKPLALDGSPQELQSGPYGVTLTPNGEFVYVADTGNSEVSGYRVAKNGAISPTAQGPVAVPVPTGVAASSNGKYLYAVTNTAPGEIHAFRIGGNGSLSAVSGSPFDTGPDPFAVVLAPNGKTLYVADRGAPAFVHAYRTVGNGSLTELASSPYPADGDNPFGMAVSPDGENLYTANYNSDTISGFAIGADGALTALPGSVYPGPDEPAALTFNASGSRLYAVSGDNAMAFYDAESDGELANRVFSLFGNIGDFQSIALTPAQPPKAKLKKVKEADPGKPVKLSAKRSRDDGDIIEYAWKFGDGKKTFTMGPKVEHQYRKAGKYKVTVTLTDDDNCSTKYVGTGQTAYCNGSKRARTSTKVKVEK